MPRRALLASAVLALGARAATPTTCVGSLEPHLVDDGYCDCPDGTDEPSTSACAGVGPWEQSAGSLAMFTCGAAGTAAAATVASSRVGDRVCDCCDGSDEAAGACPDVCAARAEAAARESAAAAERMAEGRRVRETYAVAGAARKAQLLEEQKAARAVVYAATDELARLQEALAESHALEVAQKEAARADALVHVSAEIGLDDVADPAALRRMLVRLAHQDGSAAALRAMVDEALGKSPPPPPPPPPPVPPAAVPPPVPVPDDDDVFDDTQGYGGDDDEEGDDEHDEYGGFGDDDAYGRFDEEDDLDGGGGADDGFAALAAADAVSVPQADTARSLVKETEKKLADAQKTVDAAAKTLSGSDYGEDWALHALDGECYTLAHQHNVYEICPYGAAYQRDAGREADTRTGTRLGDQAKVSWEGDAAVLSFTGGEKCWSGPVRSATVTLRCGLEDKLVSAGEPETCVYVFDMVSPAMCR